MNTKSIEELGFFQVLSLIQGYSLSCEGKQQLKQMGFLTDSESLLIRQEKVSAFLYLLARPQFDLPLSFVSIEESLKKLSDIRLALEGNELVELASYIRSSQSLASFTQTIVEDGKALPAIEDLMGEGLDVELKSLAAEIDHVLDASGQVRESHPILLRLRREVERTKNDRSRYCRDFIHSNPTSVQSDQSALRDGRLVIPVRNDHRSEVQGFVNSASASGNTVFMEPYSLVELNNSVVMAENQIQIEIAKILRQLNDAARKQRIPLSELSERVAVTDSFYSLARFAQQWHCCATDLKNQELTLINARHPLLGKNAVPIDFSISAEVRSVVVSGPNAGGKTVTIKTVALLSLLNQFCGYIPAKDGSSIPLFDDIFTDIGDEQSIDNALSTFSGHMKQVGYILHHLSKRSLVILDELGSGTDPVEGSALARSILEYCLDKGALTLVTSHHGVLKQFAYAKTEVVNASMEFNEKSHLPTFRVIQGLPGESHALDTARMMKLPQTVLANAEAYLGSEAVQIGTIIKDLEAKRRELELQKKEMNDRYLQLQREVKEVQLKELKLKQEKNQLRNEQNTELARFMREKRKELENLVADVRSGELTREKTKNVKQFVNDLEQKVKDQEQLIEQQEEELLAAVDDNAPRIFETGMDVLCGSAKREGRILSSAGKGRWLVALGSMRMTLKEKELSIPKRQHHAVSVVYHSSAPEPKLTLDVRGMNLSEALSALDGQIESALVHGMSMFSIIHGYGDGILSRGIGTYLKESSSVKDFRFALPEDGGMGKTYVML